VREKQKPFRIDKEKLSSSVSLQAIAKFKQGQDFVSETGERLSFNDYTLPPQKTFSYAYCSDTAWYPEIISAIKKVDLLYHEATFLHSDLDKAIETQHSTAKQAAEIAKQAEAGKLLLGHFSARYKDLTDLLNEAQEIFSPCALACEGDVFTLTI
jgi:ribonuclease Z